MIQTNFDKVKDSNEKTNFETGSKRDTQTGKGRPDLIPPFIVRRDSRHYENGADKYAARNWELGQPSSQYAASAQRHLWDYLEGDRSEDHLAAIRWNVGGLAYNEEMVKRGIYPPKMLDLPDYTDLESWTRTVKQPALEENERRKAKDLADFEAAEAVKQSVEPNAFELLASDYKDVSYKSVAEVRAENEIEKSCKTCLHSCNGAPVNRFKCGLCRRLSNWEWAGECAICRLENQCGNCPDADRG